MGKIPEAKRRLSAGRESEKWGIDRQGRDLAQLLGNNFCRLRRVVEQPEPDFAVLASSEKTATVVTECHRKDRAFSPENREGFRGTIPQDPKLTRSFRSVGEEQIAIGTERGDHELR